MIPFNTCEQLQDAAGKRHQKQDNHHFYQEMYMYCHTHP